MLLQVLGIAWAQLAKKILAMYDRWSVFMPKAGCMYVVCLCSSVCVFSLVNVRCGFNNWFTILLL